MLAKYFKNLRIIKCFMYNYHKYFDNYFQSMFCFIDYLHFFSCLVLYAVLVDFTSYIDTWPRPRYFRMIAVSLFSTRITEQQDCLESTAATEKVILYTYVLRGAICISAKFTFRQAQGCNFKKLKVYENKLYTVRAPL